MVEFIKWGGKRRRNLTNNNKHNKFAPRFSPYSLFFLPSLISSSFS